jgi:hypothetical protein
MASWPSISTRRVRIVVVVVPLASGCPRSLWEPSGTTILSYGLSGSSRVLTREFSLLPRFGRLCSRSDVFSSFFGLPLASLSIPDAPDVSVSSVVGLLSNPLPLELNARELVPSLRGFVVSCGWFRYVVRYVLEPFWALI